MAEDSCPLLPHLPQELHTPWWHADHETPIVDGKYQDPKTGEVVQASGHEVYQGPPSVDIVISNHDETTKMINFRIAMPFPMGFLLCRIMRVVEERKLELDTVIATSYAIRVILAHELTEDEYIKVCRAMTNDIWVEK